MKPGYAAVLGGAGFVLIVGIGVGSLGLAVDNFGLWGFAGWIAVVGGGLGAGIGYAIASVK